MSEENEMEVLARAAFYVTDAIRGAVGEWEVTDTEWMPESALAAYAELCDCLSRLKADGWKDRPKLAELASYSHNIRVGVFYKCIPNVGDRWISLRVAERFGLDAKFEVHTMPPYQD